MSSSKTKMARVHAMYALAADADDVLLLLDLPDLVLDRMLEELSPVLACCHGMRLWRG
jgi:hypothetical protein